MNLEQVLFTLPTHTTWEQEEKVAAGCVPSVFHTNDDFSTQSIDQNKQNFNIN